MFDITITLSTPYFDGDEDVIFEFQADDKKEVRKIERALMRGLDELGKMADAAEGKKGGIFAGTDPQEVHFRYHVAKAGKKWTAATHEWPDQTDVARAHLKGLLDGLMKEAGKLQHRRVRGKGKGRA